MISVLLAAYNGELYIKEQINSLLSQTVSDFKLYVRDDISTDNTYTIIKEYSQKHPDMIVAEQSKKNTGGAEYNFINMMIEHKDDYVMLCDQDDVWLPDKIEKSLKKIKEMEEEYGADTPLLVHTDLKVVSNDLNVISSSYQKMASKDFNKNSLNYALALSNVGGSTVIYNRTLANLIQAVPDFIVMHDWWLALIAAAFGKIGVVNEATVLYRQHEGNDKGAKRVLSPVYIFYVLTHLKKMAAMIDDSYKQAGAFLRLYEDKLPKDKYEMIQAYASIPRLSRIKRLKTVMKYKAFMHGFARKTAQIMILFTSPKKAVLGTD
ncbi:MAG: glycosyltransferase family 2 protein [Oscillospiraceae bacterium]|nr:glycosyltransferase family 2 protein [Oscillospiraceae bacterium]